MDVVGGYCTLGCGAGAACPAGSTCVETGTGDWCERSCSGDGGCRAGFACDPVWRACAPKGLNAPRAPACPQSPPPPRSTFGPPQQISGKSGLYQAGVAAALGPRGELVVVYQVGKPGEPPSLAASSVALDGSVVETAAGSGPPAWHSDARLAADARGRLYLVWLAHGGAEQDVRVGYATSADAGRSWTPPATAHDAKADCPENAPRCLDKPMIAIGPDERTLFVFYYAKLAEQMKVVRLAEGSFGPSLPVGGGSYGDAEVAADQSLQVVYLAGDDAGYGDTGLRVEYVRSSDGGESFSAPVTVNEPDEPIPFYFASPQVAIDDRRNMIYVAYATGTPDGRWDLVLAASSDGGAVWTRTKVNDDAPCASHILPAMAVEPRSGRVHLAWTENRGGVGRVVYAACETGGARCSPNEAVSDVPFATYSLGRKTPRSFGDHGALVLDPRRRAVHVAWTQPVDEGQGPVARIFAATGKLK
jgi:hypothetical protein